MIDYTKWQDDPFLLAQAEIVEQYAEWAGEDAFQVAEKIGHAREIIKEEYARLGDKFYTESNVYIYDMLAANPSVGVRANLINKFIPDAVKRITEHPGKTFADFGAGMGVMCELATILGKEATHIDLPSYSTDFAKWRNEKLNLNIKFVEIAEDYFVLPNSYDIVFTDAVWEHLTSEKQLTYARDLPAYINPGGMLYMLIDLSGVNPDMPMHYNCDVQKVHEMLLSSGLKCEYGLNNFASVWYDR